PCFPPAFFFVSSHLFTNSENFCPNAHYFLQWAPGYECFLQSSVICEPAFRPRRCATALYAHTSHRSLTGGWDQKRVRMLAQVPKSVLPALKPSPQDVEVSGRTR